MWKLPKDARKTNRNKSKRAGSAGTILLALLLVFAVAAAGVLYLRQPDSAKQNVAASSIGNPGKKDADFNSRCDEMHAVIDRVLSEQNMVVADDRRDTRENARKNNEGKILWNARSLLMESTGGLSAETVRRGLETVVKKAGGSIIVVEPDKYHGFSVTRIDVGFKDQLGGGPLTIISDRLYIVNETVRKTATVPRQKTNLEHKGEIALIIDDFGYRQDMVVEFAAIRRPFTFAVIPFKSFSKAAAAKGLASGHQVMLHLPMEPLSGLDAAEAPTTVRVGMSAAQIRELIEKSTASLPGVSGVNNHQGSKATADRKTMEDTMKILKEKTLFFVDSRTNGQSVAAEIARRDKVKTAENDLFIDGIAEVAYVKKQLRAAGELALRMGSITVIGHARPATAVALREMIPELEDRGIRFVFVSQLVR